MRREELYLCHMVEAAHHIAQFIAGLDRVGFQESELVASAVVQKLAVIGEAVARMSDELTARYPEVRWWKVVAFRNILVHAYLGIDWDEVWRAASKERPALRDQIAPILRAEFGGGPDLRP